MTLDRSGIMRTIKSRDTKPELSIRRLVHKLGFRFRLYRKDLPGNPDLAFIAKRKVIFVHGCFWHGHTCARGARTPKTNTEYWTKKVERNQLRDRKTTNLLKEAGWRQLVVWECEIKQPERLRRKVLKFLQAK